MKKGEEYKLPVFIGEKDGKKFYIIPMYGKGLWDAIWGFIALDDTMTVQGVYFDHKGETPGLGANIKMRYFMDDFKGESILNGTQYAGMVAHGEKDHRKTNAKFTAWHYNRAQRLPDSAPGKLLYGDNPGVNNKGHQGPHCLNGKKLEYSATDNTWSGEPLCVMFGSTGTETHRTPKEYCSECTKLVKKLDLAFE